MVLFVRILAITIINLYTVRLVLNGLGDSDYGIFYAVAGVVMTLSCLLPVMSVSVQRFLSYSMGQNDSVELRNIFSASVNISVVLSLTIILLMLTVGIWFMTNNLNIPSERMWTIPYITVFTTFSLVFTLLQIPFTATIFAHEDMNVYAFISFMDCVLKLLVAIAIGSSLIGALAIDNLVFYSAGLMTVALITFSTYAITACRRYEECRYHRVGGKERYRKLLSFSGWTLYGAVAGIGMTQGNTVVLNVYFGTVTTAAFGVANSLYNAFNSLTSSIVLAFSPRMVKSYAAGELDYLDTLFKMGNKALLYLLIACCIPLVVEMPDILMLWLGKDSETMTLFCRLFIVYAVCLAMNNPITTIIQATGKLKYYHLTVESLTILCVPLTWLLFHIGMPAHYVFIVMILLCIAAHVVRLLHLAHYYPRFSASAYLKGILLPGAIIALIVYKATGCCHYAIEAVWPRLFVEIPLSFVATGVLAYTIGCDKSERQMARSVINHIIKR